MDALSRLNELPVAEARGELLRCCGSQRWAEGMCARRPFPDPSGLFAAADEVWGGLETVDWLEAFAGHPKIGDKEAWRQRLSGAWAAGEQAGVRGAPEHVLTALAEGNRAYEERFGHIFIVCATGKSADEMLALLEARLPNEPRDEIRIAAGEQARITRIRLEKLLSP